MAEVLDALRCLAVDSDCPFPGCGGEGAEGALCVVSVGSGWASGLDTRVRRAGAVFCLHITCSTGQTGSCLASDAGASVIEGVWVVFPVPLREREVVGGRETVPRNRRD